MLFRSMAFFLISQVSALKARTNTLGIGRKFVVLGPQRTLSAFEYQNIVQLVQYQRAGAGSASTKGLMQDVLTMNGDELLWCYDDTLIGKGAGGNDAVVLVMPEVESQGSGAWNTNRFADLAPGLSACTMMLCDRNAPTEIPTPLPGGAVDVVSELRVTSGWGIRPEAVTIMSMQYQ